jgi:hypothetical protein
MAGKKTIIDGIQFDSKLEAEHYQYLKTIPNIKILKLQPEFVLYKPFEYFNIETNKTAKFSKMIYTGDFLIELPDYDKPLVLESKGFQRSDYMLRKKLFIMLYHDKYNFLQSNSMKECKKFFDKYK